MAVYNVQKDGNAPKEARAGDYVVTAGGTYQVLDGAAYQGMNEQQLAAAGVGYNPSSGLYSRKVSNATSAPTAITAGNTGSSIDQNTVPTGSTNNYNSGSGTPNVNNSPTTISPTLNLGGSNSNGNDVVLRTSDAADEWLQTANNALSAQLESNYNTNVSNAKQAYVNSLSGLHDEAAAAKANYLANILQNREDIYFDAISAMNGANNRGMVNSPQGQAMTNSMLWKGALRGSELRSERDTLLDSVYNDINTLTTNYNIQLSELEKNKLQDELEGMSNNQLAYLAEIMEIDAYNADARNTATQNNIAMNFEAQQTQAQRDYEAIQTQAQRDWEAQQAALDREWQSGEAALDRELEQALTSSRYSGGGGGSGGSSGSGSGTDDKTLAQLQYYLEYETGSMTDEQKNELYRMFEGVAAGIYTPDNWMELYNRYRLNNNAASVLNNNKKGDLDLYDMHMYKPNANSNISVSELREYNKSNSAASPYGGLFSKLF